MLTPYFISGRQRPKIYTCHDLGTPILTTDISLVTRPFLNLSYFVHNRLHIDLITMVKLHLPDTSICESTQ